MNTNKKKAAKVDQLDKFAAQSAKQADERAGTSQGDTVEVVLAEQAQKDKLEWDVP